MNWKFEGGDTSDVFNSGNSLFQNAVQNRLFTKTTKCQTKAARKGMECNQTMVLTKDMSKQTQSKQYIQLKKSINSPHLCFYKDQ